MALSYDQSNTLMNDMSFRGRVKVACLKFANYILNEDTKTPAHNTRSKWAANCMQNPDMVGTSVTPQVTMDAAVQAAGATIDDAALQISVETTINSLM